ncbi:MAG: GIY-YIG nuclease family protein [Candidatus Berkelbacteria bacterium]|nr:GIY-YIG nuclease family protein [Candidatus Berkelbacteria bacterium]
MEINEKIKNFPDSPGVYLMQNKSGEIIYVGKATSLKERVRSYYNTGLESKTQKQMQEVVDIEFRQTDSPLDALFLEAQLIKKYSPKYNIKERDDKSRIYVHITRDKYPRIELIRETDLQHLEKSPVLYGPFLSTKSVSDALELIRKIIPFRSCRVMPKKKCLYGYIGLCDAPCERRILVADYKKNVRSVRDFFEGKKSKVLSALKKELKQSAKNLQYEKAAKIRDKIYALNHIKQMFIISRDNPVTVFNRIEGYDISNISGAYAVGSMVVFIDGVSEKSEYRKFKIKSINGANDTAMIKEVLTRRIRNDWPMPDIILIDGGRGQVNIATEVLKKLSLNIPVIGLAKGPDRKKDELITSQVIPRKDILLFKQVRDEAHRFAKGYYEKLHRKTLKP